MVPKGYIAGQESAGKKLKKCYDRRAASVNAMNRITEDAAAEGRATLDADETAAFKSWEESIQDEDRLIARLQKQIEEEKRMPTVPNPCADTYEQVFEREGKESADRRFARTTPAVMVDREGREFRMLSPEHRLADIYTPGASVRDNHLSIGKMLKGSITGDWRGADAERRAMGESSNNLGGYLVPDALWSQVLDLARAQSAYVRAGARTIPMESETLAMPRIDDDPTFAFKAENAAFNISSVGFGLVNLVSRTFGTIIEVSEELLMDAPMAAEAIETSLVRGLAASLDSACLIGVSPGMSGLIQNTTIVANQTGSVGAIAWEDLHNAVTTVRANNFEPNSYVCHPTIAGDLDIITSGDGSTSAKLWQGAPPSVSGVRRFTTTALTTAHLITGDFSQCVLGVRMQPRVEISRTAGETFEKFQAAIRIVWRGDTAVLRPTAFHLLAGITT